MNEDPSELTRQFAALGDDALIARCRAGVLSEDARLLAMAELVSRGLTLPARPRPESDDDRYEGDFVTLARFLDPIQAQVACGCLEASGVPAMVADANLVQTNALWSIAIGGARVLVPASRLGEAEAVMAAFRRGDFALRDDDDPGA